MSKWRVRKGKDLQKGMRLRFGNTTTIILEFLQEDEDIMVKTGGTLFRDSVFRLDMKQSYTVLVDDNNEPIITPVD